jgi:hypothetical protein
MRRDRETTCCQEVHLKAKEARWQLRRPVDWDALGKPVQEAPKDAHPGPPEVLSAPPPAEVPPWEEQLGVKVRPWEEHPGGNPAKAR